MNELLLIDANSLIHRCFHALPSLTDRDGRPAQALYGISSILLKLWRTDGPAYAAALFDRPEPTFRKKRYPAYKATRPPAPDALIAQIIAARDLFPVFGIPVFEAPGYEADDLIATLAERFGEIAGLRVVILTGDADTLQLVRGDRVVVRAFRTGVSDTMTYDEAAVRARYGLSPGELPDYKALVGDASDNIAGVPGVGPKTAARLLQQFGTLDALLQGAAGDPKLAERIGRFREQAELAKELVLLARDAPVPIRSLDELRAEPRGEQIRAYFERMGFESLLRRLSGAGGGAAAARETPPTNKRRPRPPQGSMF